jgi:hypothetical protein
METRRGALSAGTCFRHPIVFPLSPRIEPSLRLIYSRPRFALLPDPAHRSRKVGFAAVNIWQNLQLAAERLESRDTLLPISGSLRKRSPLFAFHKPRSLPSDNPFEIHRGEQARSMELPGEVNPPLADLRAFADVERVRHQR